MHNRIALVPISLALSSIALSACLGPGSAPESSRFTISSGVVTVALDRGTVDVDTNTLETHVSSTSGSRTLASSPVLAEGEASHVRVTGSEVSWTAPDGHAIRLQLIGGAESLSVSIDGGESSLKWPVTSPGASTAAIQFANGTGLSVPVRDPFWTDRFDGLVGTVWPLAGELTLPVWGVTNADGESGVAFYTPTDIGTDLTFDTVDGALSVSASHDYSENPEYVVVISPTSGSPIDGAGPYRDYLQASGQFVTLDEKIAANPHVGDLVGAPHAYLWGTGRTTEMLDALVTAGIDRAWLGYDADGNDPDEEFVTDAQQRGVLIGPYDSWANAQDPADSDASSSIWPGSLYPDGCVRDSNGEIVTGFGGRGCYLSSAALEDAEQSAGVISDRAASVTHNGQLSYFLDVDAAGQLFEDHSPDHPQSLLEDRQYRLERMKTLSSGGYSGQRLVVGSESAAAWANPAVSFSHGSSTPIFEGLWEEQGDAAGWGGYWPEERPAFFFQPTRLRDHLASAMFDPRYRIPLYQAVLHDSIVSTDRWEIDMFKVEGYENTRTLLALLYNSPPNYAWDLEAFDNHRADVSDTATFFGVIQSEAGTEKLLAFETLTDDRTVQRTSFAGELTLTANFGTVDHEAAAASCIVATKAGSELGSLCLS